MHWTEYEKTIYEHFKSEYPNATITHDVMVPGRFSKKNRQVDILIKEISIDHEFSIVIDGKYHNKKIDVNDVESFLGFLKDVSAHKGIMISPKGYTTAAINRAHYDDLDIDLDILNFKDLAQFHAAGVIVYAEDCAATFPAPFGWIVDGTRREGALATLYLQGNTLEVAAKEREWMYVNFWIKRETILDIESLISAQEIDLRSRFQSIELKYFSGIERSDAKTKIRLTIIPGYPALEYTGFVEFKKFIFYCVLFTPVELEKKNLRKLRSIMRRVLPFDVIRKSPELSPMDG